MTVMHNRQYCAICHSDFYLRFFFLFVLKKRIREEKRKGDGI